MLGFDDHSVLYETVVLLEPGETRDLGDLQLTRAVHHYRIVLDLPTDADPKDVHIQAYPQSPDGETGARGFSRRTPEGDWLLYTVDPATHVRLHHDDLEQPAEFNLVEGDNLLTLSLP